MPTEPPPISDHLEEREASSEDQATTKPAPPPPIDLRAYRAGLIFGAITLVMLLGVIKDLWALYKPSGKGQLLFGFLILRYSSVERVWLGWRFYGADAWFATIPHVVLYTAGAYGLITLRRWGWYLLFVYLFYIPLSEALFLLFYPFGYLTGLPYPIQVVWAHVPYLITLVALVILSTWMLWRYRDLFVY